MKAQDLNLRLEEKLYNKGNIYDYIKTLGEAKEENYKATNDLYREVLGFLRDWFSDEPTIEIQTSGSTGTAKRIKASKKAMLHSAEQTCKALQLKEGDTTILCISPKYIGGMMMIVRAMFLRMKLLLAPVQANPLSNFSARANFIALVPMQVQSILSSQESQSLLKQIDKVIVGGASLNIQVLKELKDFPNAIYSTYGMTETLSHIALKKISGKEAGKRYYPLENIQISLSDEGSLNILAPYISDEWLETNDLVQLYYDGSFEVLGRKDNVVNSGGVKLQIEKLEEMIRAILPYPIALTSVADEQLGEALVLLIEECKNDNSKDKNTSLLLTQLKKALPHYSAPKHILFCEAIPLTANGKIDRKACKNLAKSLV